MAKNNIENKEQTDTYDKLIAGNGDLFSESGFDEMQKAKNHEIGFKCFRTFFWVMYIFSMTIVLVAEDYEILPFTLMGLGATLLCIVFFIIYSAKAAAAGVMNRRFAETMSKKYVFFSGIAMVVMYLFVFVLRTTSIAVAGLWVNLGIMYVSNYLCARKNMKVLEKMLKDNDEEE